MATQVIAQQPDFEVVAQSFQTASIELAKCSNIVSFQENAEIMGILRGLVASVARIEESLADMKADAQAR